MMESIETRNYHIHEIIYNLYEYNILDIKSPKTTN